MNTYRTLHLRGHDEGEEWELFAVVNDEANSDDNEELEFFCECSEKENADLIVSLLNNRRLH